MFLLAGLTFGASAAQAADVNVPDANLKATLNAGIAAATGTTRTPTQAITTDDARAVTTIEHYGFDASAAIGSFQGLEAFTNLTSLAIYNTDGTATDLGPIGALPRLKDLVLSGGIVQDLRPLFTGAPPLESLNLGELPIATLDGIGSLSGLKTLVLGGGPFNPNSTLRDISPLSALGSLTSVTIDGVSKLRDVSALASSKDTITSLQVSNTEVSDVDFLEGFKRATNVNLYANRIEDVSVFSKFDASYALPTTAGSTLDLSSNRIRDFSPVDGFRAITGFKPLSFQGGYQDIYVGALDAGNGVDVQLKPGPQSNGNPGAVPRAQLPAVYNATTGRLTAGVGAASALVSSSGGGGEWTVHFSEAADRVERLRINEVESDGDLRGDWVELYNPLSDAVDVSGVVVSDGDDAHKLALPEGTRIAGKGYKAIVTDAAATPGNFVLGAVDAVRLFAPGTTDLGAATPFDSYAWTQHAATTSGRTAPGAGVWRTTRESTFELPNTFNPEQVAPTVALSGATESIDGQVAVTATVSKPGGAGVAGDATGGVVFTVDGQQTAPIPVQDGVARLNRTLEGTPQGSAHTITARYVSGGVADPYADSATSAAHTVTVTILEFAGTEPTIPATVQLGQPVTVTTSSITPAPDTIGYQWQDSAGNDISGATQASYTLDYSVNGSPGFRQVYPSGAVRVKVTVAKAGYRTKTFTTAVITPEPWALLTTPAATLSTGAPRIGDTITASHPEWTSPLTARFAWYRVGYQYEWLRDGQLITGATDSVLPVIREGVTGGGPKVVSYTVTPADEGHRIALRVRGGGSFPALAKEATVDSTATAAVAKALFTGTPAPLVDKASPTFGDTLTASTAAWAPAAAFTYQWLRDGQPIDGATSASYKTVVADVDRTLSVEVTGTATGVETKKVVSAATAKVQPKPFAAAPAPVIDVASPKPGDRLTASVADWSPTVDLAWQWLRDGQPIAGATSPWYVATDADLGHALSVRATGRLAGHADRSVESPATAKVQAPTVQEQPKVDPPKEQVSRRVSAKYRVAVTASKGKTLKLTVSAPGFAAGQLPVRVTLKVAGVKQAYTVRLKDGKATLKLGARASRVKTGKKVAVSVSLPASSATSTSTTATQVITTTYAAAKATAKVTVRIR
ncbi:hypothetical protein OJ997_08725 [Solirubrobacter phytolaccae]|uniref:Uncharacterized protein n=1 Tax=Solirubrobacter phytolaccae TaxID=1404360 RepID=A0A9X3S7K0_9ACTN|nr:hypothetical protein [Solirubrobacter phytolaccae]MDA0180378.1 hypothetical protein [Solirubrobacter phytolaccae]